jgi:hypothetical protein
MLDAMLDALLTVHVWAREHTPVGIPDPVALLLVGGPPSSSSAPPQLSHMPS